MNIHNFKKGLVGLQLENKSFKLIYASMILANLVLGYALLAKTQPITIIPPNLTETAWLDEKAASSSYMKAWALYIADSFGNANPATLDLLKNSIGPFLDASIYTKVMKAMDDQIDQIKRDRISLSFNPVGVITDPLAVGTFYVTGNQTLEGITGKPSTTPVYYEITVNVKGYRPIITFIEIKSGKPLLPSEEDKHKGQRQKSSAARTS